MASEDDKKTPDPPREDDSEEEELEEESEGEQPEEEELEEEEQPEEEEPEEEELEEEEPEDDNPLRHLLQMGSGKANTAIRLIFFPTSLPEGASRKKDGTEKNTAGKEGGDEDDEDIPTPPPKRARTCPHPILHEMSSEENRAWRELKMEKKDAIINACKNIELKSHGEDQRLPTRFRVLLSHMPPSAKRLAMQRAQAIANLPPFSSDGPKQQAWLEKLLHIPFGRYIEPPQGKDGPRSFLLRLQSQMDKAVYGMPSVKKSILQAMAQWISSPQSKGLVLGIQGPPGVGKTSLVRGIAETLGRPFMTLNMGGFRDGSGLLGHEMTYVGSTNGALSDTMIQSGCMNPILYMDEVDKIARHGAHGDEITGILVHLTDETQNHEFQDRYFGPSVPLDFSRCWFIFSFNDENAIDPILLNRMTVIRVPSLVRKEKIHIATEYLWPRLQKELGVQNAELTEDAVAYLLDDPSVQEPGVRMLKTRLRQLLQAHQMAHLLEEKVVWAKTPWICEVEHVEAILNGIRGEGSLSTQPPFGMYM